MSITIETAQKIIKIDGRAYPCRIGRKGAAAQEEGREGDEKTPLGTYIVRFGFYRADRLPPAKLGPPPTKLTLRALREDDGWCDDPAHPAYNRFVALPFEGSPKHPSCEKLWREDGAYDVVLVISHNDDPPVPGLGSAVFIHIAQPDDRETLGCVAVTPDVMVRLLRAIGPGTRLVVSA